MWYLLGAIVLFVIALMAVGCKKKEEPIPEPTPPTPKYHEVPPDVLEYCQSPELISQWVSKNINYIKDTRWLSDLGLNHIREFPMSPAEVFSNKIKINGKIYPKQVRIGDCSTYGGLTAYFLKQIGYEAGIFVFEFNAETGLQHMLGYGFKNGYCCVFDLARLHQTCDSPEEYIKLQYNATKVTRKQSIDEWLQYLYDRGHARYYDKEL